MSVTDPVDLLLALHRHRARSGILAVRHQIQELGGTARGVDAPLNCALEAIRCDTSIIHRDDLWFAAGGHNCCLQRLHTQLGLLAN